MSPAILLSVEDLTVRVGARTLLHRVSFDLRPGEALTVVGESGAGKSLLAQAVMGHLPAALRAGGMVTVAGARTRADDTRARRLLWGRTPALLPQLGATQALVRGAGTHAAAIAVAHIGGASVLLADGPTRGLDAHGRDHTVELMHAVRREGGCVVVITHDLRVARALGGQLIVLRAGEVLEQGDTHAVFAKLRHPYTRRLVQADPARWPQRAAPAAGEPVVTTRGLAKGFGDGALFERLDLEFRRGERWVVRGPSGSGRSTLGNVLLGLLPPDQGIVRRAAGLAPTALQKLHQDPVAAFAPGVSLERSLRDAARHHGCSWPTVMQWLYRLGVSSDHLARRPSEVSGGELQRIAMARVLIVRPALLFADEPTSGLDPVTQQEALGVLLDALEEDAGDGGPAGGTALLLVTHDDDIADAVGTRFLRLGASPEIESPGGLPTVSLATMTA